MNNHSSKTISTKLLAQLALLLAVEAIVCFTPLGSLPIGPIVATLSHIPVIITALTLGPKPGAFMGFMFGLFSFIVNSFIAPTAFSFVFTPIIGIGDQGGNFLSLIICFVPRILIGPAAYYLFTLLQRFDPKKTWSYVVAGVGSSLLHTVLVLGMIYLFFKEPYSATMGTTADVLLGVIGTTILTNGILEAVLGGVIALAVAKVVAKIFIKKI